MTGFAATPPSDTRTHHLLKRVLLLGAAVLAVLSGVAVGLVVTRGTNERSSAQGSVVSYLSSLQSGDCAGAVARLTRAAEEQIRLTYEEPEQLCQRLRESRRIPTSFEVLSSTPRESDGELVEVVLQVSYPDGTVTETYYAVREEGVWRVQPPWA